MKASYTNLYEHSSFYKSPQKSTSGAGSLPLGFYFVQPKEGCQSKLISHTLKKNSYDVMNVKEGKLGLVQYSGPKLLTIFGIHET